MRTVMVLLLATTGCSATKLYGIEDTDNGGVPFYPLVAVDKEIRIYEQAWLRVDITVNESFPLVTDKETMWKDVAQTTTLVSCPGVVDFEGVAKDIASHLTGLTTPPPLQAALIQLSTKYCRTEPPIWSKLSEVKTGPLIGLQREIDQVPATTLRYLNVWTPHGGSANADIKLDARGTLSEASAQRQDQLPQSVASAAGAVGAAALTALGTIAVAALRPPGVPVPHPIVGTAAPEPKVTAVTLSATRAGRIYTVVTVWPAPVAKTGVLSDVNPCLSASDVDQVGQCQLGFSVTTEGAPTAVPANGPSTAPASPPGASAH
jgi:hypothetical protein